ncbi:MAG: substrate-binding domain-containing protein [Scytonematopsis contorta HA4267-MV1]|jgi:phosphate transport system substrate-binding protein|nr:substrate-binding domain-containing protein [Scytonematopsis contorta HA4267-MV1]
MKQNLIFFAFVTILLVGLSSCSTSVSQTTSNTKENTIETQTPTSTQASIKIGGSSAAFSALKALTTDYESTLKNIKVTQLEPGQSENVIAGVKQGIIDVGAITKILKPEENDGTLEFRKLAKDGLLIATHKSVTGVKNLTTENLKGIYGGSIVNWKELGGPDAKILVLDRPEDESAKRLLRKHYLGQDMKNSKEAVVLRKEGELIQSIQSTPYSIGAFSLAYAISHNLPVNRLSLNDIEPTGDNIKTGKYPMVRTLGIIWKKNATDATKGMIDYIFGQQGSKVLEESGFVSDTPKS